MKYRCHEDFDHPDDAMEIEARIPAEAAAAYAERLDSEVKGESAIPESRNITVWEGERQTDFVVRVTLSYFATAIG